jgi:hypothetical protein
MSEQELVTVGIYYNNGSTRITMVMSMENARSSIDVWRTRGVGEKFVEFHGRIDGIDANNYSCYFVKEEIVGIDVMEPNKL